MNITVDRIHDWIREIPVSLQAVSEGDMARRPQPDKWSSKEILGHLCDSALTNLQRFVRAQYEAQPYTILKYDQNQWVALMAYQDLPAAHILNLWTVLNKQIAEVIAAMPEERLLHSCDIGDGEIVTLEWLIEDYVRHMEHHLGQILGAASV